MLIKLKFVSYWYSGGGRGVRDENIFKMVHMFVKSIVYGVTEMNKDNEVDDCHTFSPIAVG